MFIIHVIDSFLLCHIDIFSKALLMLRITKYRIVKFPFKSFSGGINVKKKCQGDIFSSHTGPSTPQSLLITTMLIYIIAQWEL